MCSPKSLAVLEVELVLAGLLDRHRELEAVLVRQLRDVAAELLVDEHAGRRGVDAALDRDAPCPRRSSRLASVIVSVSSGVGSPSIPNIFFWNEPR